MARLPRLVIPHQLHHIVQHSVDRQAIFNETEDYQLFLDWLREAARKFKVHLYAYVLMPDHVHLLAAPDDAEGLARMMQWVGRYYVPYFNRKYGRAGTLWQGRFKANVVDADACFFNCCRYMEQHPVRSALVPDVADYRWSSYAHHVGIKTNPLVTDHPLYWALGNTPFDREIAYRNLAQQALTTVEAADITAAVQKGWVLGTEPFKVALEKQWNRQVRPAKRGRPVKLAPQENGK
jgi:putative transposase